MTHIRALPLWKVASKGFITCLLRGRDEGCQKEGTICSFQSKRGQQVGLSGSGRVDWTFGISQAPALPGGVAVPAAASFEEGQGPGVSRDTRGRLAWCPPFGGNACADSAWPSQGKDFGMGRMTQGADTSQQVGRHFFFFF